MCACGWEREKEYVCVQEGDKNNLCNPAILFNEEWKAGIQRRGYVPHINMCSVDILPLFEMSGTGMKPSIEQPQWEQALTR